MSDTLIIDTGTGFSEPTMIEPLPVYDENYYMLTQRIPDHNVNMLPNPVIVKLARRLQLTMEKYNGIGLAANQCGIQERMFVMKGGFVCINPVIIEASAEMEKMKEGCLSYPGLYVTIPRHKWVEVEFYDENGVLQKHRFEGVTAQCFQHELDHINGVVFTSHAGKVSLQLARDRQKKLIKKFKRIMK